MADNEHTLTLGVGKWSVALHGSVRTGHTVEPAPRGSDEVFIQSMVGVRAMRTDRTSVFELSTMLSADPIMGPEGYPLLLQTGETADGFTPLFDRQHPHDLLMELAAALRVDASEHLGFFAYAGPVGEPALGPTTYMHRLSGRSLPATPISHHWLDATHISYGVATFGAIVADRISLEASAFNGREPDHHRWGLDTPRLDSYTVRLGVYPTRRWAFQVSGAHLREPERLHPGMDIERLTASLSYGASWSGGSWHMTTAAGANKRDALLLQVGNVTLTVPARTQMAVLVEGALNWRASVVAARFEIAEKDELFPTLDPRHTTVFRIAKSQLGYRLRALATNAGRLQVGAAAAAHFLPENLSAVYGASPVSLQFYVEWSR